MDNRAISRILAGDRRPAGNQERERVQDPRLPQRCGHRRQPLPHNLASLDEAGLREIPGIGQRSRGQDSRNRRDRRLDLPSGAGGGVRPTILDLLRLQGVGPKNGVSAATASSASALSTISSAPPPTAGSGRCDGMGARKNALIRRRHWTSGDGSQGVTFFLAAVDAASGARGTTCRPGAGLDLIRAVGGLRRGCETCGDLDLLRQARRPIMDAFVALRRGSNEVLGRSATKVEACCSRAAFRPISGWSHRQPRRCAAVFHWIKAHHRRSGTAPWVAASNSTVRPVQAADDVRSRARPRGNLPRTRADWIPPELREMRGEIAASHLDHTCPIDQRADLRGDLHAHTTGERRQGRSRTMAQAARAEATNTIAITGAQPGTGDGQRPRRAPASRPRRRIRRSAWKASASACSPASECQASGADGTSTSPAAAWPHRPRHRLDSFRLHAGAAAGDRSSRAQSQRQSHL